MLLMRDDDRNPTAPLGRETERERVDRFRAFVRQSSDGIWCFESNGPIRVDSPEATVVDEIFRNGRLVECNASTARMYGVETPELLVGAPLDELLPRSDPRNVAFLRAFVRNDFRLENSETVEIDRDGQERIFLNSLVGDVVDGCLVRAWGTQRDVTEQRRVEGALRESEERLRQSQKMEAMGRLAGGVAHDFNNLLTVINGYADLLLKRLGPEHPYRSDATEVRKAGEKAVSLTRQLLTFSRKRIYETVPLDLNMVVGDMEKLLGRLIGEDVDLAIETDPNIGTIYADPGSIEQVVMNLVVNARDAMPRGGKLTIETSDVRVRTAVPHRTGSLEPGRYALLIVTDTGEGMDAVTQEHVFEPFFTTKAETRGTGLGLATVYGIVTQAGGHVAVQSQPGAGATFMIYLPAVDRVRTPEPCDVVVDAERGGSETILVVEDEEDVRRFIQGMLELSGYAVICARDGDSALRAANESGRHIDLLLTDVVMPTMDGAELQRRLAERQPDLRVLYMSGYHENAALNECLASGEAHFLAKPFSPATLADKVRSILEA